MGSIQHCLVTGATGFIGRRLVSLLLEQRFRIRALCRHDDACMPSDITVVRGDLHDADFCLDAILDGVDTVFHLANTAHVNADKGCYEADAAATVRLAAAAARAGVERFVFVSSTKAMAEPGHNTVDESFLIWPLAEQDPYGYWKRMAEDRLLAELAGLPHLAILRPALVYGPGQKGNLRSMINAVRSGWFPALPDSSAVRSMVSVTDVASALLLLAREPAANRQVFIAEDGEAYTAAALQQAILQILKRRTPVFRWPFWSFRLAGWLGDAVRLLWPSCPLGSDAVQSLLCPSAYSAARLRSLGWQPSSTFYTELPAILAVGVEGDT